MKSIVVEFYANLTKHTEDRESVRYEKVFVRNTIVNFCPDVINDFLGSKFVENFSWDESLDVVAESCQVVVFSFGHPNFLFPVWFFHMQLCTQLVCTIGPLRPIKHNCCNTSLLSILFG